MITDFLSTAKKGKLEWIRQGNIANNGATVGYRRVSGKIGLTDNESGIRGAWVEKRVALFKSMLGKGYRLQVLSPTTDETARHGVLGHNKYVNCDVLILEFGGTNWQFYGDHWLQTFNIIRNHCGPIIFICDDPDLPFLWDKIGDEDWSRWTIAANACHTDVVGRILKCPPASRVVDYPMLPADSQEFSAGVEQALVYIGRPGGRTKYFREFLRADYLDIAGKVSEWQGFDVKHLVDIPAQKNRQAFYRKYAGCLSVYDDKHRQTGWRTGRAYHALFSGTPVCAPSGNDGLYWTHVVTVADDISRFAQLSATDRRDIWNVQMQHIKKLQNIDLLKL